MVLVKQRLCNGAGRLDIMGNNAWDLVARNRESSGGPWMSSLWGSGG